MNTNKKFSGCWLRLSYGLIEGIQKDDGNQPFNLSWFNNPSVAFNNRCNARVFEDKRTKKRRNVIVYPTHVRFALQQASSVQ